MQETMTMLTPNYGVNQPEAAPDFATSDQAQLEADKRAVYKHPLFPLLALLFERCEQATQSAETPNSESFNNDIQAFVLHQERDRKPFLLNDPEVDGLMIKAIQVLRIHLLELEKVQELCKDFCNRYITCLKGKMQSENLLRSDYNSYENNNNHSSDSNSPVGNYATSPHSLQLVYAAVAYGSKESENTSCHTPMLKRHKLFSKGTQSTCSHSLLIREKELQLATTNNSSTHSPSPSPSPSFDYLPPVTATSTHLAPHFAPATPPTPPVIHGSTPLSQIGVCSNVGGDVQQQTIAGQLSPPSAGEEEEETDGVGRSGRRVKRGVLPKHATGVMRSWLFQHLVVGSKKYSKLNLMKDFEQHPYPTEDEKRQIAAQTNLTLLQVNNWFINARRRILQPMLDASQPNTTSGEGAGSGGKTKKGKGKQQTHVQQRFWPDALAQLQPPLTESTFGGSSDEEASEEESEEEGGLVISDENVQSVKEADESEDVSDEATAS